MAISKRLRYEVLRRDNHACRYCGATAPAVQLTIDHVVPTALGGSDEPSNIVTACTDCNAGKSSSTPDAELVADVSSDALRWGRAMAQAASIAEKELAERHDIHETFLSAWEGWSWGSKTSPRKFPLPTGWQKSIDGFLAAGLPLTALLDCIDVAMAATHVDPDNTWRYMCGIAWKRIGQLQDIARSLIEAEDGDG